MQIPFLNLKPQHQMLKDQIMDIVSEAIDNTAFVGGKNVNGFEEDFARFCGTSHAIAVNSGTDALRFALLAAGLQPGDEVITTPNTFIATTEAISQAGGKIVFVDIDERTDNIDVEKLATEVEKRVKSSNRLKGILPVHLYGQMADMDPILEIAQKYGLFVIEDACQAHGALYQKNGESHKAGSMGLAGAFSFYPGKNLGSCGEGGAIVTNNADLAQKAKMYRDHGQSQKYYHDFEGFNGRMHAIQAGILKLKLKYLPEWIENRRQNAALYGQLLKDIEGVIFPQEPEWSKGVYHLYVIKVKNRDDVQKKLAEKGISTGLHYPIPLHLQNAYKHLGYKKGDFPVTEKHAEQLLSLPMFPELTKEEIEYVVSTLKKIIHG
ncbi:erythromycin biosynthesis sensory transduction protein eryC1 [candidate division KSB1 bacterium 4484_87]|nr:MAG: erythromycin biosynthesis sensory transduction protein eryC1 [candidate division KSB1 bacterium 4484_87]